MIPRAKAPLLEGKRGLIVGIANEHSIAWGCAKAFRTLGAELAVTYLNEKARKFVEPLAFEARGSDPDAARRDAHRASSRPCLNASNRNGASSISWSIPSRFRPRKLLPAASSTCRARAFSRRWMCRVGHSSAWRTWRSR